MKISSVECPGFFFFYSFSTLCSSLTIDGMKATLACLLHLPYSTQTCTESLKKIKL